MRPPDWPADQPWTEGPLGDSAELAERWRLRATLYDRRVWQQGRRDVIRTSRWVLYSGDEFSGIGLGSLRPGIWEMVPYGSERDLDLWGCWPCQIYVGPNDEILDRNIDLSDAQIRLLIAALRAESAGL